MKKLYVVFGFFFLGLGIAGIFVPVLPTVPFLLLASYFFTKGSERCRNWFVSTAVYRRHLLPYEQSRALPAATKRRILFLSGAMLAIPFLLIDNLWLRIFIIILVAGKYYFILCRIKTSCKKADI